ncbi:MAG: DegT/DnrJ/EryC1/StrS family aminotransferase [Actinomycetota bacterium]
MAVESSRREFLPFALPTIGEVEIKEVVDSLESGWISTGPKVREFEGAIADYVGADHAVAVSSCTAGLHLSLQAFGVRPGDEVIVPTMTFCSTANVVEHLGARPVLVDVGTDFNVSADTIRAAITDRTKAVVPVHFGGQAVDLDSIYRLALEHDLAVVEDAAHAIDTSYGEHRIGASAAQAAFPGLRRAVVYSFYATKNLTTAEGGMVVTTDEDLAAEIRMMSMHGMSRDAWKRYTSAGSWYYEVVAPGFKANMTDLQAALGLHQLARLPEFTATRQALAARFDEAFADVPELETPIRHTGRDHVFHLYVIRLDLDRLRIDRSAFIDQLREVQIGTSVHFIPVHQHPYYAETYGYAPDDLPVAASLFEQIISLPLYPRLTTADIDRVAEAVIDIIDRNRVS